MKRGVPGAGRLPTGPAMAGLFMAMTLLGCADAPVPDPLSEAPAEGEAPAGVNPLEAPTYAEAQEEGTARIQVLYVPADDFAYRDEAGDLTGVTVELMREFARFVEDDRGVAVEPEFVEEQNWSTFYQRVRYSRGGVFGIGNVTVTEARRSELAFSPPYMSNVAILITHRDVPELESLDRIGEEFADMTALVFSGTLHEERLEGIRERYFPEMATAVVGSNDGLIQRVASGEGYFGYVDVYNYWRGVQDGLPLRHHPVGDDDSEEFGVIMPQDSDWEPVMRAFFEAEAGLLASDGYRELLGEHLGAELASLLLGSGDSERP
jgi:ABC-type amino acid transport substrate-binding protein